jgi:hypothetical protein
LSSISARRPVAVSVEGVRFAMLAVLPVAILVASPQRVGLSAVIAAAYAGAAVFMVRRTRANAIALTYLAAVALWMLASWLRTRYFVHLDAQQLAYGTSKVAYFALIVVPMAAAVTVMIDRPEDARPTAVVMILIGAVVAAITLALLGQRFLGADRYSWQGNLIALGTVVAVQPWPVRSFKASAVLGVVGVMGIMFASSRQAVAATVVALVLTAAYWAWSRNWRYAVLPAALVVLTAGYIATTYAGDVRVQLPWNQGARAAQQCHCVTDRIVSLETSSGDRDLMLSRGLRLFLRHPILGAGVGAFAGTVPDSLHPGQFYQYPHNVALEIAAETGTFGLLLFFVPLLAGWALLFRRGASAASAPVAVVLAVTAVFFTVANVSGDIPSERGLWIFGAVAFKLGVDRLRRREVPRALAKVA